MTARTPAEIAVEFLTLAAAGQVDEAFARHVADAFTHHNVHFPGDRESLRAAMAQSARTEPNKHFVVKQVVADGDRVVVFSHLRRAQSDQDYAVVHLLRFEGAAIVELWDLGQEIPKSSPNLLGAF